MKLINLNKYTDNNSDKFILDSLTKSSDEEMIKVGISAFGQNGLYDIFHHRITFPIYDKYGHPIAFTARDYTNFSDSKYINSANTILYSSKNQIKGLTTSVALWASGILGLLIGIGAYTAVLICFASYLLILSILPKIEIYLKNRSNHFEVHLELKNSSYLKDFTTTLRELGLKIDDIEANPAYLNSGLSVYTVSLSIISDELKKYKTHTEIITALKSIEYIYHIEEM